MNITLSRFARVSIIALAASAAMPAHGQDSSESSDTTGPQYGAGEIIVTAQRREESMQDVPMTINAISAAALEQSNVQTALDISKVVPGIQFENNQSSVVLYIRGVGTNQGALGSENTNALYIDGVYYSRVNAPMLQLSSIERIEVLKGPQGTLFGRNSSGGLIQIVTRTPEPGDATTAKFEVGYTNYDQVDVKGYLATTLSDNVAMDIAGTYTNQNDGWGTNLTTGREIFKRKSSALRSKIVIDASDLTRLIATGYYNRATHDQGDHKFFFGNGLARQGYFDGSGEVPLPTSRYDTYSNSPAYLFSRNYGGALRLEQELPFAQMVNITAFNNYRENTNQDLDNTAEDGFYNNNVGYEKRFTNELQFFNKGGDVDWTAGVFYMRNHYGYDKIVLQGLFLGGNAGDAFVGISEGKLESIAGYAQVTYPLTDKLKLTAGGRYSHDKIDSQGGTAFRAEGEALLPPQPTTSSSKSWNKFIWKGVLSYDVNDDVMVYASQSRGSKTGVYSLVLYNPNPVDPETLDAYEVGFKSQLADRRVRLNAAAFLYEIKDLQVQIVGANNTAVSANAAKARVKGIEFDAAIDVTDNLTITGAGLYLDAKFTDYTAAPQPVAVAAPGFGYVGGSTDATGNRLPKAPKWSGNIGFQYSLPVGSSKFQLSSNYSYNSGYYFWPDNQIKQDSYGLLDARVGYKTENGMSVALWASNITKEKYYTYMTQFLNNPIGDKGMPSAPRRYGITLGYEY